MGYRGPMNDSTKVVPPPRPAPLSPPTTTAQYIARLENENLNLRLALSALRGQLSATITRLHAATVINPECQEELAESKKRMKRIVQEQESSSSSDCSSTPTPGSEDPSGVGYKGFSALPMKHGSRVQDLFVMMAQCSPTELIRLVTEPLVPCILNEGSEASRAALVASTINITPEDIPFGAQPMNNNPEAVIKGLPAHPIPNFPKSTEVHYGSYEEAFPRESSNGLGTLEKEGVFPLTPKGDTDASASVLRVLNKKMYGPVFGGMKDSEVFGLESPQTPVDTSKVRECRIIPETYACPPTIFSTSVWPALAQSGVFKYSAVALLLSGELLPPPTPLPELTTKEAASLGLPPPVTAEPVEYQRIPMRGMEILKKSAMYPTYGVPVTDTAANESILVDQVAPAVAAATPSFPAPFSSQTLPTPVPGPPPPPSSLSALVHLSAMMGNSTRSPSPSPSQQQPMVDGSGRLIFPPASVPAVPDQQRIKPSIRYHQEPAKQPHVENFAVPALPSMIPLSGEGHIGGASVRGIECYYNNNAAAAALLSVNATQWASIHEGAPGAPPLPKRDPLMQPRTQYKLKKTPAAKKKGTEEDDGIPPAVARVNRRGAAIELVRGMKDKNGDGPTISMPILAGTAEASKIPVPSSPVKGGPKPSPVDMGSLVNFLRKSVIPCEGRLSRRYLQSICRSFTSARGQADSLVLYGRAIREATHAVQRRRGVRSAVSWWYFGVGMCEEFLVAHPSVPRPTTDDFQWD